MNIVCLLFACFWIIFARARSSREHINLESSKCLEIVFMVSIRVSPNSLVSLNTNKVQIADQLGLMCKKRVSC